MASEWEIYQKQQMLEANGFTVLRILIQTYHEHDIPADRIVSNALDLIATTQERIREAKHALETENV